MTRKEFLEAAAHNAMIMMQVAEERDDRGLGLIAHATLTAITAVEKGHDHELAALLFSFVEFAVQREKEQFKQQVEESEMPDSMVDLLKESGIGFSNN